MKVGSRLSLGFGVLALLGLTGMYQMSQVNDDAHDLGDNGLPRVRKLAEISNELGADRRAVLRHVIERKASAKQ